MALRGENLLAFVVVGLCLSGQLEAQLQVGFYAETCSQAESIVRKQVRKALRRNIGLAAGLVRLHFHDCFVRGCDGSVLINSTSTNTAEKDSPANNPSLRGFEVIDNAKARIEAACKGKVSCADILAFAARDSIVLTGGVRYQVPAGRRDGRVSLASETQSNLPGATLDVNKLTQSFANKNLTQDEMVTLSGAHTIGRSHCTSIYDRLYNFSSTVSTDPSLDPTYAAQLEQQCPKGSNDTSSVIPMDPPSPNKLDSSYYRNILVNRGLFESDQNLLSDNSTAKQVRMNAAHRRHWKRKFSAAMVKMGQIGVLTGNNGEIRLNCWVINSG